MAADINKADILALPVGTLYSAQPTGRFEEGKDIEAGGSPVALIRTESGFTYLHPQGGSGTAPQRVPCNDIAKSGGVGSAIVGNSLPNGTQVRFEWLSLDEVQYEYWFSLSHKAGTTRNKPPQAWATLAKQDPIPTGQILTAGSYNVRFEKGNHWSEGHFTLLEGGRFEETRGAQGTLSDTVGESVARAGSWKEVDGDFWLIDQEVHRYKLISQGVAGQSVELRFVPDNGPADEGYKAIWTPA